jgi:hypothetical protein
MTKEKHCYKNGLAERVNGILKDVFLLDMTFHAYAQAQSACVYAVRTYKSEFRIRETKKDWKVFIVLLSLYVKINQITKYYEYACRGQNYRNFLHCRRFLQGICERVQNIQIRSGDGKRHRNRPMEMSDSEIITILMLFLFGTFHNFKHFYLFYIGKHLKKEFHKQLSYNRFVEIKNRVFHFHDVFSQYRLLGQMYQYHLRGEY